MIAEWSRRRTPRPAQKQGAGLQIERRSFQRNYIIYLYSRQPGWSMQNPSTRVQLEPYWKEDFSEDWVARHALRPQSPYISGVLPVTRPRPLRPAPYCCQMPDARSKCHYPLPFTPLQTQKPPNSAPNVLRVCLCLARCVLAAHPSAALERYLLPALTAPLPLLGATHSSSPARRLFLPLLYLLSSIPPSTRG